MSKFLYCPFCGKIVSKINNNCPNCKRSISPIESIHDSSYYKDKSIKRYGFSGFAFKILIEEEASKSIYFDKNKSLYNENNISNSNTQIFENINNKNIPKCPTCGSTNISKISGVKRAVHGYAFGLFSKTARSQFECKNCGYKW